MKKILVLFTIIMSGLIFFYEKKIEEVSYKSFVLGCQVSKQTYCRKNDNCTFRICKDFLKNNDSVISVLKGRDFN